MIGKVIKIRIILFFFLLLKIFRNRNKFDINNDNNDNNMVDIKYGFLCYVLFRYKFDDNNYDKVFILV